MPNTFSQIKLKCQTCEKTFFVKKSRVLTAKFCSVKCVTTSPETRALFSKQRRGVPKTEKWKAKASLGKLAEKNGMWKGKKAGLDAIHIWVAKRFPRPKLCQDCKKVTPRDLANISQKYKRDLDDWEWLCRKCHMKKDGRLAKLIKRNKNR